MRRRFGRWKLPPVIFGVAFGVWAGLVNRITPPASSDGDSIELALFFTGAALVQLACVFALPKLHNQRARKLLSIYYAAVMLGGVAVSIALAFHPELGPFIGLTMSIGFTAMAFTAFYILHNWDSLPYAHADAAVFLGSTHVLALVAVAASAAREWMPDDSGSWMQALTQTTYFSLTALALPLSAGIWTRLAIHRSAEPAPRAPTPPTAPTDHASTTTPAAQSVQVRLTVVSQRIQAPVVSRQSGHLLRYALIAVIALLAARTASSRRRG